MNILKISAVAAALLLAVPALASRNAPDDAVESSEQKPKRGERRLARLAEELGLSEAQTAEIAAIKADFKDQAGPSRDELKALRTELKVLWAEQPVDVGAIQAKADELDEVEDSMRDQRIEMKAEMLGVMTPEQQSEFVADMGERRGHKGKHGKRGKRGKRGQRGQRGQGGEQATD